MLPPINRYTALRIGFLVLAFGGKIYSCEGRQIWGKMGCFIWGNDEIKHIKNWILGGLLAVILTATASAADIRKGYKAFQRGDCATAFAEFFPLAETGNADAQFMLGVMYAEGDGATQDYAKAVKLYRLAANAGHAETQNNLRLMYQYGNGVAQDDAEAVKLYRLAANAGHAETQNNLRLMYQYGNGVAQDDAEAVKCYRLAVNAGLAEAQYNLGMMYHHGRGIVQNDVEAAKC